MRCWQVGLLHSDTFNSNCFILDCHLLKRLIRTSTQTSTIYLLFPLACYDFFPLQSVKCERRSWNHFSHCEANISSKIHPLDAQLSHSLSGSLMLHRQRSCSSVSPVIDQEMTYGCSGQVAFLQLLFSTSYCDISGTFAWHFGSKQDNIMLFWLLSSRCMFSHLAG